MVATDERLLVAEHGRDGTPSSAIWSESYADISLIGWTLGLEVVTLFTEHERFHVPLPSWSGQQIGQVLSAILECRRGDRQQRRRSGPRS
jgi:hypothetical protein